MTMHVYTHRRVLGNQAVAIDGKTVLPELWRCPRPYGDATGAFCLSYRWGLAMVD